MAKKAQTETNGHGVSAIRKNGYDKDMAEGFVQRLLDRHGALDKLSSEHMLKCKDVREEMREILDEAKGAGIPKKALKGVVQRILLESKIEAIREDLEGEDQDSYDNLEQALGILKDTPLGSSALARAGAQIGSTAAQA